MPSSFSPSLRLELIAPGEQAGTWNITTNTNLGTLLESSIAGFQTVSVTAADQALTIANGAADQARNAMLRLTTTTSAAFNVYAPPSAKQYTVFNDSSHAATIFNSTSPGNTTAAGTGITIPAGRTLVVFTDGTNFRTVDVVGLTGVLAVANGGTGATTAAGARTNLGTVNDPGSNGILVRTGANITTPRAISVSGTGLSIANGDGVAGNPAITISSASANTPNTLVVRDGSGNFSAGTISASLTGNVTGNLTGNAATVTNGVYTVGNQTIAGVKTFSGTLATANASITGGNISGITDLAIADGGTGASTAVQARTNLGLTIGTDVLAPNGNGSALTNLNANALATGTVPATRSGSLRLIARQNVFNATTTGTITVSLPTSLFEGNTPSFVMFSANARATGCTDIREYRMVSGSSFDQDNLVLGGSSDDTDQSRTATFNYTNTFVLPYNSSQQFNIVFSRGAGSYAGTRIYVIGYQV